MVRPLDKLAAKHFGSILGHESHVLPGRGEVYGGQLFQQPPGEWPEALYNSNPTYTFCGTASKMLVRNDLQFGAYVMRRRRTN